MKTYGHTGGSIKSAGKRRMLLYTFYAMSVFAIPVQSQNSDPRSLWLDPPLGCTDCLQKIQNTGDVALTPGVVARDGIKPRFTLGWNWGDVPHLAYSTALNMNTFHAGLSQPSLRSYDYVRPDQTLGNKFLDRYPDNARFLWVTGRGRETSVVISSNHGRPGAVNGFAMHFDPIATINPSNPTSFVPYTGPNGTDKSGAAFGFAHRTSSHNGQEIGSIVDLDNNGHYRYQLQGTVPGTGLLVLDRPWPDDQLFKFRWGDLENYPDVSGERLYLSINLRCTDCTGGSADDVIVELKAPYVLGGEEWPDLIQDRSYLTFSSLPSGVVSGSKTLKYGRGNAWDVDVNDVQTLQITRSMLPTDGSDITISGYLILDGVSNSALREKMAGFAGDVLHRIGLEARYFGGAEIAVDWIRFETPHARNLFRGEYDESIRGSIQDAISFISQYNTDNPGRDLRIESFYGVDESHPLQWWSERYYNKLLGDMVSVETATRFAGAPDWKLDEQFLHIMEPNTLWPSWYSFRKNTCVPYYPSTETRYLPNGRTESLSFGLQGGYQYNHNLNHSEFTDDALHFGSDIRSQFETIVYRKRETPVPGNSFDWPIPPFSPIGFDTISKPTLQARLQHEYIGMAADKYYPLFADLPWYANIWAYASWGTKYKKQGDKYVFDETIEEGHPQIGHTLTRTKTAEELRQMVWASLLLGAKGLLYYRATGNVMQFDENIDQAPWYRIGFFANTGSLSKPTFDEPGIAGLDLLMHEGETTDVNGGTTSLPGDFLDLNNDPSNLHTYLNGSGNQPLDDYLTKGLELTTNERERIYTGSRSLRLETRKVHDWIQSVQDTLMRLNLRFWHSRGYLDTPIEVEKNQAEMPFRQKLEELLDLDETEVRAIDNRPFEQRSDQGTLADGTEYDMRFMDIMYHELSALDNDRSEWISEAEKTSGSNPTVFYIGVQNRRTDPTVICTDCPAGTPLGDELAALNSELQDVRFYSAREFDSLVHIGTLDRYEQLGSREISLKFDDTEFGSHYSLIHVREIGPGESNFDNGQAYEAFDTVLGQGGRANIKFKPGEGKLLRIEVLPPDQKMRGLLANSNQRKLVGWPVSEDNIVYHATFHKLDQNGDTAVFYRRSLPADKNTASENVVWEDAEVNLSMMLQQQHGDGYDCGYPSIVVRENSSGVPTVYVVYACRSNPDGIPFILSQMDIAENVFAHDASSASIPPTAAIIGRGAGAPLRSWGTPVVNASSEGNFYAWSDDLQGIVAGYKDADARQFSVLPVKFSWSGNGSGCQHPSINTYSRERLNDPTTNDQASVVWQENDNIYFSRLDYDAGIQQLRRSALVPSGGLPLDPTGTAVQISRDDDCVSKHRIPVVYRSVEDQREFVLSGMPYYLNRDIVFWESRLNGTSEVRSAQLSTHRLPGQSGAWTNLRLDRRAILNDGVFDVSQPDVTQGSLVWDDPQTSWDKINVSDSAFVSAMTLTSRGIEPGPQSLMIQLPFSYESGLFTNGTIPLEPVTGQLPHLSVFPEVETEEQWRRYIRLFEFGEGEPPLLTASHKYFLRSAAQGAIENPRWIPGFTSCCSWYGLSSVILNKGTVDETVQSFHRNKIDEVNSVYSDGSISWKSPLDSVVTGWFIVGDGETVSIHTVGTDTSQTTMELVRRSDGQRWSIPQQQSTDDQSASELDITLLNGGGNEYRVEFYPSISAGPCAAYTERFLMKDLPVTPAPPISYKEGSSQGIIVNLAEGMSVAGNTSNSGLRVFAFPNPANEALTIGAYWLNTDQGSSTMNQGLKLSLYSSSGVKLKDMKIVAGMSERLSISSLPPGVYFIQAEGSDKSGSTEIVEVASFIIER